MTSHEFRTPLTTILSSTELLEKYHHKFTPEKKQQHFTRIKIATHRMVQLLDDVLLIGKAESGKLTFSPAPLDLREFCNELVEEVQASSGSQHNINYLVRGPEQSACMDEKLLRQILFNLLSNAIKYSPIASTVYFQLKFQDKAVVFEVKDQGIGIPLEDQKHLFETFHRAKNVGTIPGTGLGLAIVKKSVDLHGGQIVVESVVGVGTTFIVTLPLSFH
jgi:signal transduction histidine kinase